MKRFNFNAVRTSHYPNDPALVEIADELGMYVIAEADIESHAFYQTLCDDPRYLGAWVDRCARLALRDKNHASIIAWSLGNESGYGANHDAAAGWLRHYDPSRPIHYEGAIRPDWTSPQTASDFTSPMYPTIASIVDHATNGTQRHPLIMCEYSHAMGNSNGTLAEYWDGDRVDARAPGRVHLGVLGPRARPAPAGRHHAAGRTAATGATSRTTATSASTASCSRTGPPSPACGSTATSRRLSGSRPTRRARPAGGSRSRTGRTSATSAGCARTGSSRSMASRSPMASWPCRRSGRASAPIVALDGLPAARTERGEARLTVRFRTAAAGSWAPAGFEVCSASCGCRRSRSRWPRGSPAVAPNGAWSERRHDRRRRAAPPSRSRPPAEHSLWRAPTDNDRIGGMGAAWTEAGLDRLERHVREVDRSRTAT